jgi:hypothetical protein
MGIRIFDVDTDDAAPKQFDDVIGFFRSGYQVNNRPVALQEWLVTSADPDVVDAVAAIMGGTPEDRDTEKDDTVGVFTTSNTVEVILAGPAAIRSGMVLWGRNSRIRECDGVVQGGDNAGEPCVCPSSVKERKEKAKKDLACSPSMAVYFRLAEDPDLGVFRFTSGSWSLAAEIGKAEAALERIDGPALATLALEVVEYTTKAGRDVSFTKPVLKVRGAA